MSLFNTKKETNKQPINEIQKAKGKRAKTAQQTIPYEEVYPNGIIKVAPGLYSKSYYFGDMNFTTEKEDKQEEILKKYSKLLSKYAPNVTAQFTIFNRRTSAAKIKERFLLKPKSDDQQIFRDDYNKILADKIEEGRNDIQKAVLAKEMERKRQKENYTVTEVGTGSALFTSYSDHDVYKPENNTEVASYADHRDISFNSNNSPSTNNHNTSTTLSKNINANSSGYST